jgi:hypothetical protein
MGYTGDRTVFRTPRSLVGARPGRSLSVGGVTDSPLETRIDCCVSHWNDNPEPFVWTRPADEILDKVARGQATLDRITKSATHH